MQQLQVSLEDQGDVTVLKLEGTASAMNVQQLSGPLMKLAARRPPKVVIDMARLDFISSLPIGELVSMARAVKLHGGTVRIAGPRPAVREILDHVRLGELMPIFDSVDLASEHRAG